MIVSPMLFFLLQEVPVDARAIVPSPAEAPLRGGLGGTRPHVVVGALVGVKGLHLTAHSTETDG